MTVLSETLLQVIVGFGFPSAEQFKVNSAGAVMVWLLEVIMFRGGPTKSKIRTCTWLKSCCGFCIFTSSTLRVKLMPITADELDFLQRCSSWALNFYSNNTGWEIQNSNYGAKCDKERHLILPFWQQNWTLHCYSYSTQVFCFCVFNNQSRGQVSTPAKEN